MPEAGRNRVSILSTTRHRTESSGVRHGWLSKIDSEIVAPATQAEWLSRPRTQLLLAPLGTCPGAPIPFRPHQACPFGCVLVKLLPCARTRGSDLRRFRHLHARGTLGLVLRSPFLQHDEREAARVDDATRFERQAFHLHNNDRGKAACTGTS